MPSRLFLTVLDELADGGASLISTQEAEKSGTFYVNL